MMVFKNFGILYSRFLLSLGEHFMRRALLGRNRSKLLSIFPPEIQELNDSALAVGVSIFTDRYKMLTALILDDSVGIEVGVMHGNLSNYLISNTSLSKLMLVDQSLARLNQDLFSRAIEANKSVELYEGDSELMLNEIFRASGKIFDFVYIDANHTLDFVKKDAEAADLLLKTGGILFFNDYTVFSWKEGFFYGVVDVVNDFCNNRGYEIVGFSFEKHMYCDIAIRKK